MLDKLMNILFILVVVAYISTLLYLGYKYNLLNVSIVLAILGTVVSSVIWWC